MHVRKILIVAVVLLLFLVVFVDSTNADELSDIKQQINLLQKKLEKLEAEKQQQDEQIEKKISDAVDKKQFGSLPDSLKWVENVKLFGDIRYRHENTDDESATRTRDRARLRARFGLTGKVNDEVDATFALASGSSESATNTNQELTGAFSSKSVYLDLAYLDYHPAKIKGFNVLGGKIKNPYGRVGNSDLMFDTDVRPEGIAATYKMSLNTNVDLIGMVGGHWLQERTADVDTGLWVAQVMLTQKIPGAEGCSITAGAGFFDYGNIEEQAALGTSSTNFRGNRSVGGNYESDFDIIRVFGQAAFPIAGQPCAAFAELLSNTDAVSSEDTGYLVGASVGKCKKPGSLQFAYNFRDVDADATPAALMDSTFGGGGSNVKGHKLSMDCQIAKNWKCSVNYMMAERTRATTTDHDVFQFDLNYKF